jgi:hypothetical protein
MTDSDATQITASARAGAGAAKPGDVLAERYEILEVLESDGPTISHRAIDQETERPVLVRVLQGPRLDEAALDDVVGRLRALLGIGGRFLSSLLDADREAGRPFTVEAWPSGMQLSAILAAKRERGESLGPREILPVAARLAAALSALPVSHFHGDVRVERVWVDTDGLRLTGPFLLSVLPAHARADRIRALGPGAALYAPELARGEGDIASDRWGVAAIAWEAITSRAPDPRTRPSELSAPLFNVLKRFLEPESAKRPRELGALVNALALHAGLPVPEIDPEPHRPSTPVVVRRPPTSSLPPKRDVAVPRPRKIEGAAHEGTQEISFDQIIEESPAPALAEDLDPRLVRAALAPAENADDTSKHQVISDAADALDPRLVRAALAPRQDGDVDLAGGSLDPDLVHAALGVVLESSGDEAKPELADDSLDPALVHAALGVVAEPSSDQNVELASDEIELVESRPRAAPLPQPIPVAAPAPVADISVEVPVFVEPAAPQPAPPPTPQPQVRAHEPRLPPKTTSSTQLIARQPAASGRRSSRRPLTGALIVISAILLAVAIVGVGLYIARERERETRARRNQERLLEIRGVQPAPPLDEPLE